MRGWAGWTLLKSQRLCSLCSGALKKNRKVLNLSFLAHQNLLQILCFGACDPLAVGLCNPYLARDGAAR